MIQIGLIEDNDFIKNTYSGYFKATRAFEVVFAVSDITDAFTVEAIPSIILLDVNLPSGSGIDWIKRLSEKFPSSKIVILSSMVDDKLTKLAIENGAAGYLLKSSSMAYISESLLEMTHGGMPFSPTTIAHLVGSHKNENTEDSNGLTKREWELIKLLSEGYSNKIAADKLRVTYFTINQHLKNIYKKLHINSKAELISWFLTGKHQHIIAS
jgi:DNA-binding NarL/FixJ family response regulator